MTAQGVPPFAGTGASAVPDSDEFEEEELFSSTSLGTQGRRRLDELEADAVAQVESVPSGLDSDDFAGEETLFDGNNLGTQGRRRIDELEAGARARLGPTPTARGEGAVGTARGDAASGAQKALAPDLLDRDDRLLGCLGSQVVAEVDALEAAAWAARTEAADSARGTAAPPANASLVHGDVPATLLVGEGSCGGDGSPGVDSPGVDCKWTPERSPGSDDLRFEGDDDDGFDA